MNFVDLIYKSLASNDSDAALDSCLKAIEVNPEIYIYYELIVKIYLEVGQLNQVKKWAVIGLDKKPDSVYLQCIKDKVAIKDSLSDSYNIVGQYFRYPISEKNRFFEFGRRVESRDITSDTSIDNRPLVTVVTALYNNKTTLERCLQSVKDQTYKNIEHIVIDGGSDSPTIAILNKFQDSLEYVISEPDKGIYDAMNKGITLANGEFICVLNSDDFYDLEHIETLVEDILNTESDVIYSNFKVDNKPVISSANVDDGIFFGNLNSNHASFLVHKKVYDTVGLYDLNYRLISDIDWIGRAVRYGVKFKKNNSFGFNFFTGGASSGIDKKRKELMQSEIIRYYKTHSPFLSEKDCIDIYNFRFLSPNASNLNALIDKYRYNGPFIHRLKSYVYGCLTLRDNFRLSRGKSSTVFPFLVELAKKLEINKNAIKMETSYGCFSELLLHIDKVIDGLKNQKQFGAKVLLHYAFRFSSPSETFIYDFVNRHNCGKKYVSLVLCDERVLDKQRPFVATLQVDWAKLRPEVRDQIYRYIFERLAPDVLVSHFALNDWKIKQRLSKLDISIPTVSMTHGIDVFTLSEKSDYRDFFLNEYSGKKKSRLTTVSKFLYDKLVSFGIKEANLDLIHNAANSKFLNSRVDRSRQREVLNILSVGRCIEWKGHDDLIHAINILKSEFKLDCNLTIVYGMQDGCLPALKILTKNMGLHDAVKFIDFVNFDENPWFYNQFDIYVQASRYSTDEEPRTETFGVAALEAIYAGLPIVVTDAGGLPSVVGYESGFSRIAKAANPTSLADNIYSLATDESFTQSNIEYANERFKTFSAEAQSRLFDQTIAKLLNSCKVAIFSSNTIQGAGYAAYRLLQSLRYHSQIDPILFTPDRTHAANKFVSVIAHPNGSQGDWRFYQSKNNSRPGMTVFSYNQPILSNEYLNKIVSGYDIVNLHWIARFLSVENIAYLSWLDKPLVLTIRDMYHLSGGCHFFHGCKKWTKSCSSCPQLYDDIGDITNQTLSFKKENYNFNNITIVVLSSHTKKIVENSIFKECNIVKIPNSIEVNVFKPDYKNLVRKKFGIDETTKVIGYVPSFQSDVKGFEEAIDVLNSLYESDLYSADTVVLLLGRSESAKERIKFRCISAGYIGNNDDLALHYSAMDVLLVPSLEETFSNTTAEAISCGTPVIGFKTGAIPELAVQGISGYSVNVGDTKAMLEKLLSYLNSEGLNRETVREFAKCTLTMDVQARAYQNLFYQLLFQRNKTWIQEKESISRHTVGQYDYTHLNNFVKRTELESGNL
ncbi:glycosyltransferase [Salinimonas sediminis]|uniref:Glycosyltransferase n=1 Tax=Salinimonas sediminis TaxID=2303538 RepID=A0A346NQP3_9ALTE|nr:glycosyltransferase [Salinimonas sediminis]AXR07850.1 glycosyltransferase [Salinimonas sediminis]